MNSIEQAVAEEIADPRFGLRTHGTPSCFNKGCNGELCKLRRRIDQRRIRGSKMEPTPLDKYLLELMHKHWAERRAQQLDEFGKPLQAEEVVA